MESARSTIPGDRNVAQTVLKRRSGYGLRDFSTTQCVKRTSLPPPPKRPCSTVFAIDAWAAMGIAIESTDTLTSLCTNGNGGEHRDDDGSCSRSSSAIVQLCAHNRVAGTDGLDFSKRRKRSFVCRSWRSL